MDGLEYNGIPTSSFAPYIHNFTPLSTMTVIAETNEMTIPHQVFMSVNFTGAMNNSEGLSDPNGDGGSPYSLTATIILATVLTCIIVITVLGNSLVIVAFVIDPKLRQKVSNFYLLNLALADFIIGFVSLPLNTLWMLVGRWPLGEVACKVWVVVDFVACFESVCAIILISLDRFRMVSKKDYLSNQTKRSVFMYCVFTWVFSVLLFVPAALGWTAITGERNINYSEVCEIEPWEDLHYQIAMIILEFFIPLFVIGYLNVSIYLNLQRRAKKFRTRLPENLHTAKLDKVAGPKTRRALADQGENTPEGVGTPTTAHGHNVGEGNNVPAGEGDTATKTDSTSTEEEARIIANLVTTAPPNDYSRKSFKAYVKGFVARKNLGRAGSIRRHKKHRKAAKKLSVLVCAFIICWAPYKIMSLVNIVCQDCFNMRAWEFVNYLLWCNSTINPVLYTFCNRRIRYNFEHFLCFLRRNRRRR